MYTNITTDIQYGVYDMTLTKDVYDKRMSVLSRLVWDITSNIEFPNPYCEDLLNETIESAQKLLKQLTTYSDVEFGGKQSAKKGWWYHHESDLN